MKKKQLLATLVMLSLMQGSVYAAPINFAYITSENNSKYFKYQKTDDGYKIIDKTTGEEFYTTRDDDGNLNLEIDVNYNPSDKNQEVILGLIPNQQPGDSAGEEDIKLYTFNFYEDITFGPLNEYANWGSVAVSYDKHAVFNLADDKTLEALYTPGKNNVAGAFKIDNESTLTINGGNIIARMVGDYKTDYEQYAVYLNVNAITGAGGIPSSYSGKFVVDANSFNIISDLTSESEYIQALYNNEGYINFELNDFKIINSEEGQRFTQGLNLVGSSLTNINANNVLIDAENAISAQDNNTELNISGETVNILGSVGTYSGSTVNFNKNDKYAFQQVNVILDGQDAILGQPEDAPDFLSGKTNINFNTNTLISAQGNNFAYHNKPEERTAAAIRAYRFSEVNLNDNESHYEVYGDIIAARGNESNNIGGQVSIGGNGSIVKGDALAANTGSITINLKNNGIYEGRVDDYQDAGLKVSAFNPDEFDETVESNGIVNIGLDSSTWKVRGQSWVTKIDGNNGIIDLTTQDDEVHAVHIGELIGSNTFVVNLNADEHEVSDMIYIGKGTDKQQTLEISNERELINQMDINERLRFATVAEAGGGFGDNYTVKGRGIRNVNFDIKYVDYNAESEKNKDENDSYNNAAFGEVKPGTDYVDKTYGTGSDSHNVYLIRTENDTPVVNPDEDLTDSGKTVINMSRANYKNAIYMDRLNKRLGEARYINNEEEQGMWVRLRHDRIGQSGDFRSMNTMYELGYDEKQECDNGERRVGFAVDYMRGSTTYSEILGKGETKRYGLWLYDTWMGDKGHYADYVAKWGHLSNDFDIRDKDSFERVTGDYSNNVFSVSAEYGRKKDIGNDWYIEPQAQLQLARVTGAEYTTTTQDTKVSVDGINSLIGRAGFRLGRDVDERSTVYIKADLLHEFLGDQTITATDATGSLRETFENKGTWYDVGFGFATALGKDSYAFMDFEKSFGNDNDETYQINAGVQWTF